MKYKGWILNLVAALFLLPLLIFSMINSDTLFIVLDALGIVIQIPFIFIGYKHRNDEEETK